MDQQGVRLYQQSGLNFECSVQIARNLCMVQDSALSGWKNHEFDGSIIENHIGRGLQKRLIVKIQKYLYSLSGVEKNF